MKKNILVVFLLLIIAVGFIQVNLFYSKETLYIKDFETVSENYSKIRDMLFEYYNKENYSEKIILDIDKSAFEIIDGDKKINMNDEEKNSLKRYAKLRIKYTIILYGLQKTILYFGKMKQKCMVLFIRMILKKLRKKLRNGMMEYNLEKLRRAGMN